jgi:hypothetical protein
VREKYCWLVADKPSEQAGMEPVMSDEPPRLALAACGPGGPRDSCGEPIPSAILRGVVISGHTIGY